MANKLNETHETPRENQDLEKPVLRLSDEHSLPSPEKVKAREGALDEITEEDRLSIEEAADVELEWSEEFAEKAQHRVPMGWFVLLGIVLLSMGGWAVWQMLSAEQPVDDEPIDKVELVEGEEAVNLSVSVAEGREEELYHSEIERVVRQYFAASKPEDFQGLIRHEERVMPLIRSYYETHEFEPRKLKVISGFGSVVLVKKPFLAMVADFEDGSSRPALLEDGPDGLKFDWETERAYQPIDVVQYLRDRPTESVKLRVRVQLDRFYAYEFRDESKYHSFRLGFPNSEEYLIGYTERGSELSNRMRKAFGKEGTGHPMILRVRFMEGGRAPKSVIIEDLISPIWAYPNDPSKS